MTWHISQIQDNQQPCNIIVTFNLIGKPSNPWWSLKNVRVELLWVDRKIMITFELTCPVEVFSGWPCWVQRTIQSMTSWETILILQHARKCGDTITRQSGTFRCLRTWSKWKKNKPLPQAVHLGPNTTSVSVKPYQELPLRCDICLSYTHSTKLQCPMRKLQKITENHKKEQNQETKKLNIF